MVVKQVKKTCFKGVRHLCKTMNTIVGDNKIAVVVTTIECKIPTHQINLITTTLIFKAIKTMVVVKIAITMIVLTKEKIKKKTEKKKISAVVIANTKENIKKKTTVASANVFVNFLEIGIFEKR